MSTSRSTEFSRLLTMEAGPEANAAAIAAAAQRLCEQLARQVTPLIGDRGVAAIYARSLQLTQRQFPALATIPASGNLHGLFADGRRSLEQQEPTVATAAAVAMLATLTDVLASLIGEGLTTRLLREAWPDFAFDNSSETAR
jgi:hypothetical protein